MIQRHPQFFIQPSPSSLITLQDSLGIFGYLNRNSSGYNDYSVTICHNNIPGTYEHTPNGDRPVDRLKFIASGTK